MVLVGALGMVAARPSAVPQEPELPIREIRGARPGPTIAIVAGVHGGKRAAVAALDSLATALATARTQFDGTVLLVGPANVAGFRAGLAQTSPDDGLNLNRVFPGRTDGRPTERLAARIMREVVSRSDYLIDLHGSDGTEAVGDFAYAARPGVDASIDSAALGLASLAFARVAVWDGEGPRTLDSSRFLQTAAHLAGVPAITLFVPGSTSDDPRAIADFSARMTVLVRRLSRIDRATLSRIPSATVHDGEPSPHRTLPRRDVTLSRIPGTWSPRVAPMEHFVQGYALGTLTDSLGVIDSVRATAGGIVLHQRLAGPVVAGTPLIISGFIQQRNTLPPP